MANEQDVYSQSYSASADLSTKQYYTVKRDATGVVLATAAPCVGILQNKPTSGLAATVRELGRSKAVVDGNVANIAVGDLLGPDANGKLRKRAANNDFFCARAEEASTVDGDIIEVTVFPGSYVGA